MDKNGTYVVKKGFDIAIKLNGGDMNQTGTGLTSTTTGGALGLAGAQSRRSTESF